MSQRDWIGWIMILAAFEIGRVLVSNATAAPKPREAVVQASRFQLINPSSGRVAGEWSVDRLGAVSLQLSASPGKSSAIDFHTSQGNSSINLRGRDGRSRVSINIAADDEPTIVLNDAQWEGRVLLGYVHADDLPTKWDRWALMFRPVLSGHAAAAIGMMQDPDKPPEGYMRLNGHDIR